MACKTSDSLLLAGNLICFVKTASDKLVIRPSTKFKVPFQSQLGRAKFRPSLCYPQPMMQYPLKYQKGSRAEAPLPMALTLTHVTPSLPPPRPPVELVEWAECQILLDSWSKFTQWSIHRNPFHQMRNFPNLFLLSFNWLIFLIAFKGRRLNLICNS